MADSSISQRTIPVITELLSLRLLLIRVHKVFTKVFHNLQNKLTNSY